MASQLIDHANQASHVNGLQTETEKGQADSDLDHTAVKKNPLQEQFARDLRVVVTGMQGQQPETEMEAAKLHRHLVNILAHDSDPMGTKLSPDLRVVAGLSGEELEVAFAKKSFHWPKAESGRGAGLPVRWEIATGQAKGQIAGRAEQRGGNCRCHIENSEVLHGLRSSEVLWQGYPNSRRNAMKIESVSVQYRTETKSNHG
ncbi:MAG: hypothetical protein JNL98_11970 [Bryobacterales bacterium]|nr:hypothetical protein [Bryobacterales bacterium]